jgi:hypothetical protein
MNRHQRGAGAASQRKFREGTVIYTKTVTAVLASGERQLWWFEEPDSFSVVDGERLLSWIRGERAGEPRRQAVRSVQD